MLAKVGNSCSESMDAELTAAIRNLWILLKVKKLTCNPVRKNSFDNNALQLMVNLPTNSTIGVKEVT